MSDPVTLIDAENTDPNPMEGVLSRLTIFARAAQPLYPPYVYTRSERTTLSKNIGSVFHQIPRSRGKFTCNICVRVIAVEIIPA